MQEIAGVALRVSVAYLYVLILLRLSGKRSIHALSPWDFLVALIVGDMFDDLFWAEIPLSKAIVGLTTVFLLHMVVSYATYRNQWIDRLLGLGTTAVVRQGSFVPEGLDAERMGQDSVRSQLRVRGVDRLAEVKEAAVEPSGDVSVLRREWAKPADGRDLPALKEKAG